MPALSLSCPFLRVGQSINRDAARSCYTQTGLSGLCVRMCICVCAFYAGADARYQVSALWAFGGFTPDGGLMFLSDSSTADLTAHSPMQTEHKHTFYGHCLALTYPYM